MQVEDERRTRRDPGRRGKGATWGLSGQERSGVEGRWVGKGRAEGGGEGEIGAERRRQESRELASPSANFITELVVFAQIISIYSTQAGNLFASECMREWNLPPRSRLARARERARAHVCPVLSAGTDERMIEMGVRGMRRCARAHTVVARPCKRTTRRLALAFSAQRVSAK